MPVTTDDIPLGVKMLLAGAAGCTADMVSFPLDTVKVRLQIQGEGKTKGSGNVVPHYRGVFNTIVTIAREEGMKGLYRGLNAGLQRQLCFSSVRIGMYDYVKAFYKNFTGEGVTWDMLTRIGAGVTTGALAVIPAQPTDVVKVRFQALDGKTQRYRSTTEAYKTIYKVEGVQGLWKGAYPNIARSAIVNVSEIVCYDVAKDIILKHRWLDDNMVCHFVSAVVAGFFATVISSPVDVIKTRYMNSPKGQYKSAVHCAALTVSQEGFFALYKGFTPSFTRLLAWNIVMWVSYEKYKAFALSQMSSK